MTYDFLKKYTPLLVYVAVLLLAVSDSGIQLLILNTVGANSRIFRKIAIWLLFLKVLSTRYTKKEVFIFLPIAIISLYNYTICGNNYCIWNILMIASMKDIDFCKLFKSLFYGSIGTLILMGFLSFCKIGGPVSITEDFGRGIIETRYCFGLYHPNIWHFAFARCVIFFILGDLKKTNWKVLSVLFILNCIAYEFSISRTGFLATTVFLLLILVYKYFSRLMNSTFMKVVLGGGCISVYLIYTYFMVDYLKNWNALAVWISLKLTTGRLTQTSLYLKDHPISLFGTRFPDDGTLFDCGFFRMLSESGWILGSIFIIAFIILFYRSLKNNWYAITTVCIFTAIYSLYEVYPSTRPSYNLVVFFMAVLIFKNDLYCNQHPENKISSDS